MNPCISTRKLLQAAFVTTLGISVFSFSQEGAGGGTDPDRMFIRGDSNDDGTVGLSDAVFTLAHLYLGNQEPACLAAADANDDERLDLSDAVMTLQALFLGGVQLPAPWPRPGFDATPGIGCGDSVTPAFKPDLIVSRLEFGLFKIGGTSDNYMRITVRNVGLGAAGPFKVLVWKPALSGGRSPPLETFSVDGLGAGSSKILYHEMPFIGCGTPHERGVTVDYENKIVETNEQNNWKQDVRIDPPC